MEKGALSFRKNSLWLKQVMYNQTFEDVDIDSISFWIQIHNLPLNYYRESMVKKIGERLGKIQEICFHDENGVLYKEMVRLRVIVNTQKPLVPRIRLKRENNWVCQI